MMSGWKGPPVLVGERALWLGSGSGLPRPAIVRWIGHLPEIGPDWTVGLELDEGLPVGGIDGSWGGRVLFTCKPRHGLIVPVSSIIPGSQFKHIPTIPVAGIEKNNNVSPIITGGLTSTQEQTQSDAKANQPMVAEDQSVPKPALRHKRRIPTPPPSSASDEVTEANLLDNKSTLRVEDRDQEDSLKKRLRLFTENNGQTQRMNSHYGQDVIDSLYSQRHQQPMKHGRSQSESANGFISSVSSSGGKRDRNSSAIFSIFRWFRKGSRNDDFDTDFAPSAPPSPQLIRGYSSSCGSVDTLFSTATANSFAFVHPSHYRPFGAANQPEKRILAGPETDTYRNRLRQRDRIRELDKNLTLKKKYHLFSSGTLHKSVDDVKYNHYFLNKSLDSLKVSDRLPISGNSTLGRKKRKAPPPPLEKVENYTTSITFDQNKENENTNLSSEHCSSNLNINRPRHRRTVSDSAKDKTSGAFVHVKGKRKAPPPPVGSNNNKNDKNLKHEILGTQSLGRKKRPAPLPPFEKGSLENCDSKTQSNFTPEEKQRLIENIAKLQAHADRRSLIVSTPPASPSQSNKMSHIVCNDSLKLEKGFLKSNKTEVHSPEVKPVTPTPVSPRPWYKRNSGNKEKSLEKKIDKVKVDDWMPEVAIVRGNVISKDVHMTSSTISNGNSTCSSNSSSSNYRFSGFFSRFEKPEEKRKSQISMLVNISELDREAAEIVQREQEKEKAKLAAQDAKFYTNMPEASQEIIQPMKYEINDVEHNNTFSDNSETQKKAGARELISLFNAFSNVTKVTVNSAFFSKEGPSIFTKEGIEKRFSMANESLKVTEEKVITESMSTNDGSKRETVTFTSKECYSESPGVSRRRNLSYMDAKDEDAVSSASSEAASPKVVIEEIEEFDAEKSKTQVLYEANKILKHHSPSPSIPTIAEISESISSVTTSPSSTINHNEKSTSVTPIPLTSATKSRSAVESQGTTQPSKNYSIWSCPRCTLENPRWRVTCEACDMWRPAVRKDVIDKLTNANMGTTISVNVVKSSQSQNVSAVNKCQVKSLQTSSNGNSIKETSSNDKFKKDRTDSPATTTTPSALLSRPVLNISKPMTVSGLLSQNNEPIRDTQSLFNKSTTAVDTKRNSITSPVENGATASNIQNISSSSNDRITNANGNESFIKPVKTEEKSDLKDSASNDDSDMEEVRKARLAFFRKSLSLEKKDDSKDKEVITPTASTVNQAKIDALFSITSKGSIATNEEERKKVKEILKEMKNSLPKTKQDKSSGSSTKNSNKIENKKDLPIDSSNSVNLGAIKKSTALNPRLKPSKTEKVSISNPPNITNKTKTPELYFVKSETIIENIKVKGNNTSVQTNGIAQRQELDSSLINNDVPKVITGKPPTPKAARKEVIVPVTVEEHTVTDENIHTIVTKEPRKIGIRAFELIRPRDFINIEAIKTGNSRSNPSLAHMYANIPPGQIGDSESTSSSSSEAPEIGQLTTDFTKPKELADFKAAVLEGAAAVGDKMNTLAVNRLLRQLESAIAGGQHQRAATLAKQLAKHKVTCSVTRHKHQDLITVDMYVEDKLSHLGPYPVHVSPTITVAQLKIKVEKEFEIPVAVQRWILGKELAADDGATLEQLGVTKPRTPVFLYLVASDTVQEKPSRVEDFTENASATTSSAPDTIINAPERVSTAPPGRGWYFNEEDDRYSFCESEATDVSSKSPSPARQAEAVPQATHIPVMEDVEIEEEDVPLDEPVATASAVVAEQSDNMTGTLSVGWKCGVCTLMNSPTRPGCLACAAERPIDYRVPDNHQASGSEQQRIEQEQRTEHAAADDKLQNYQQLMVLENTDLIASTEPFECSVCLSACEATEGVVLRDCLHTFCRTCLAHTVQFTDEAEVKCPFRDHNYACDSTLQEREIKALVTPEVYEQHLAKSVALAENKIGNAFHCKTPDCPGWCIFEDNVNIFQCPVCNQTNCLTCQAIHSGMDCKQYQEQAQQEAETNADARRTREMLEEMVRRGEALPCPTCQVVLMKKWGCDWLRCSMCKTEICWVTRGPRWGPNGKGDTSGGCQCGVNGVKCHPKCNYCH